jgi:hypothetical protein
MENKESNNLFIDIIFEKYPSYDNNLIAYFRSYYINNLHDFLRVFSNYLELDEPDMNVCKSSLWAVCQDFLGNLSEHDSNYAKNRGGIWSINIDKITGEYNIISFRNIINNLIIDGY